MRTVARHWPEYGIEGICLALFMVSAAGCAVALQHPRSPLASWTTIAWLQRVPMGIAMGATAAALIYSPMGRRSGAHMNPAVTLTFFRLGTVSGTDAIGYAVAQFIGGIAGVALSIPLFGFLPADPSVNFVATAPGADGTAVAFAGELSISFVLMLTVLTVSAMPRLARFTGLSAALLVSLFIILEAPLSGMSMNPARTLGSALFARSTALWVYFIAPPVGMLAAAEVFLRLAGRVHVRCPKLHHAPDVHCIFCHGFLETAA